MRPKDRKTRKRNEPPSPNMVDTERYERLLEVIEKLREVNGHVPVVVEGKRDAAALRALGIEGEVITYNRGLSVHQFSEEVMETHDRVVLLMDWDRAGEKLQGRLARELAGLWEEHSDYRRVLKILCQKEVRDMEGIPGLIRRLSINAIARPEG